MSDSITRRNFVGTAAATAAGLGAARTANSQVRGASTKKLALFGGPKAVQEKRPDWPVVEQNDEEQWAAVLRSGKWNRWAGNYVKTFEEKWSEELGGKRVLAVSNGTAALVTAAFAVELAPHDEVLVPPATYCATVNPVLLHGALPVFVDTDPETFQMDASKIEAAITPRTKGIIPVHLGGAAADMDTIMAIAKKHSLWVIEDGCEAAKAEWRKQKLNTIGTVGCFSFQASKNFTCGEGGAVVINDMSLYERCACFHTNGWMPGAKTDTVLMNGINYRLTEFQGALLLSQLTRLEEQQRIRESNAAYLSAQLREIPGIMPARMYEGCTRNAYYGYMVRRKKEAFGGVSREKFLRALGAEGVPVGALKEALHKEPFLKQTFNSRMYRSIYSPKEIAECEEKMHCPQNDLVNEEGMWITGRVLNGSRRIAEQIAEAFRKVHANIGELAKA
ncbi:MAG TPA: DegT/DnrJ/EryC1/StrS family aminotransferase [Bryobacteraceae bacterium]|nr:DegT/DnrJ/EryC1/StrS family aminotransferase [Bryobacteraceae bacterium]